MPQRKPRRRQADIKSSLNYRARRLNLSMKDVQRLTNEPYASILNWNQGRTRCPLEGVLATPLPPLPQTYIITSPGRGSNTTPYGNRPAVTAPCSCNHFPAHHQRGPNHAKQSLHLANLPDHHRTINFLHLAGQEQAIPT